MTPGLAGGYISFDMGTGGCEFDGGLIEIDGVSESCNVPYGFVGIEKIIQAYVRGRGVRELGKFFDGDGP
jgi:hypothetical protein